MVADAGRPLSPSARKPLAVARALEAAGGWPIEFVAPEPMSVDALSRVHDEAFVSGVLCLERRNGFGSISESVARSLPFTCGAFHTGALIALSEGISASLTSGFHHAFPDMARSYCTFNGLAATATALFDAKRVERIAIVDCDYHYGDGTQAIIDAQQLAERVLHISLGQRFRHPNQAGEYLAAMRALRGRLAGFRPDVVFYQAGADTHVDDPLGGLLTTDQMRERDRIMFTTAVDLGLPLTWNLAGGYQVRPDGEIPDVVALHLVTFEEALAAYRFAR